MDFTRRTFLQPSALTEIDQRGPTLRSVLELNPDALSIAAALDRERKSKGLRGPLHSVPVLIKDNIATHDRITTTAGSLALAGSVLPRDAFLVQQLRSSKRSMRAGLRGSCRRSQLSRQKFRFLQRGTRLKCPSSLSQVYANAISPGHRGHFLSRILRVNITARSR
jgi:hypothetical protein